jgi:hypothetical protein
MQNLGSCPRLASSPVILAAARVFALAASLNKKYICAPQEPYADKNSPFVRSCIASQVAISQVAPEIVRFQPVVEVNLVECQGRSKIRSVVRQNSDLLREQQLECPSQNARSLLEPIQTTSPMRERRICTIRFPRQ